MQFRLNTAAKGVLAAATAATTLVGFAGAASAQPYGYDGRYDDGRYYNQQRYDDGRYCDNRGGRTAAGVVIGGIAGALLGSGVAARGHRGDGAAVGAVAGGIAGGVIANNSDRDRCGRGYYDNRRAYDDGRYYNRQTQYGYNGYYDNGYNRGYYNNDNRGYYGNGYNGSYSDRGYYSDRRYDDRYYGRSYDYRY